jgi:hypothetical protein
VTATPMRRSAGAGVATAADRPAEC